MLQLTTHSPDTCGCVLGYTWDDSVEADKRESSFKIATFFQRGPEILHLNMADEAQLYEQIRAEQRSHSFIMALAQSILPTLKNEDYTYFYDDARMLHATFKGMSNVEKGQLRGNLKYEGDPGVVVWDMTGRVVIE